MSIQACWDSTYPDPTELRQEVEACASPKIIRGALPVESVPGAPLRLRSALPCAGLSGQPLHQILLKLLHRLRVLLAQLP
jgi:hypothetical protein